jgi:Domain of unknown function (DUF5668)
MTDPAEPTPPLGASAPPLPPLPPPAPPTAPPFDRRSDWAWRRDRRSGSGGIFIGLLFILLGIYFFARETLNIDLPEIGSLWPVLVIALGVWLILGGLRRPG